MFTQREYTVLQYLCKGYSNPEIAQALCISCHTAKAHVTSILKKLEVKNRTLAAYIAAKENIIDIPIDKSMEEEK